MPDLKDVIVAIAITVYIVATSIGIFVPEADTAALWNALGLGLIAIAIAAK